MVTTRANTYGAVGMLQRRKRRLPSAARAGTKRKNAFATTWSEGRPRKRVGLRTGQRAGTAVTTARRVRTFKNRAITRDFAYKRTRLRRNRVKLDHFLPFRIDRLQGIKKENPDEDPLTFLPGYYPIDKPDNVTSGGGLYPVYCASLTRIPNVGQTTSPCLYRLRMNDLAQVSFDDAQSQSGTGSAFASTFVPEYEQGTSTSQGQSCRRAQHLWFDIRLKLYGARRQDVTYDIYLVRFKQDWLSPDTGTWNAQYSNDRTRFWQELARPAIVNSILPGGYNWRKDVVVVRSRRIHIKSDTSDDMDRNPDSVDLRWNLKDGRVISYSENPNVFASDLLIDSVGWLNNNAQATGRNQDIPHYVRDRLFLIIRATDMETRSATVAGNDDPSFDLCIRRKTRYFPVGGINP